MRSLEARAALRRLLRRPGFTAAVVVTLALGLGATTALWSVVRRVLLDPLPLPESERVLFITREGDVSIPDGVDWRAASPSFESIALFLRRWTLDLSRDGEPERLVASVAEPELFDVLRVEPLLGRVFGAADNVAGGARVAVLSEAFWRRRFAADPQVVGRTITLSDRPTTVIGVLPDAADFLDDDVAVWVPAAVETPWAVDERGTNNFDAVGRLAPGVALATARAELKAVCERLAAEFPKTNAHKIVVPIPLLDFRVGNVRQALWILLAAVGLLLLLACLNTGGLLLARTLARRQELGVRAALGAGPRGLLSPLGAEAALLVGAGGLLGLATAHGAMRLLVAAAPADLPRLGELRLDLPAVLFALAATAASALLAVALPAWRTLAGDPGRWLGSAGKGSGGGGRRQGLQTLAAVQVGIATVLLVGAGLLGASFARLLDEKLGFDPEHVVTAWLVLPESRYDTREPQERAFGAIVERVAALPGVEHAAFVVGAPLAPAGRIGHSVLVEGRPPAADEKPRGARSRLVIGEYFDAVRHELVRGRQLEADDRAGSEPVAVVNERFAAAFFPGEDPIGRRIAWRYSDLAPQWMRIVGVARDVKSQSVDQPDEVAVYQPYSQRVPDWVRFGTLVVRAQAPLGTLLPALREAVWSVEPSLPVADVATLDDRRRDSLAQRRFQALLLGSFAAAAVLLALQGVVALVLFRLAAQRFELGLRAALGATGVALAGRVLRLGLVPTLAGLAAGLGGALACGPLVTSLLFGVAPWEPAVLATAAALVAGAALAACLPLALGASRLDPATVLREE